MGPSLYRYFASCDKRKISHRDAYSALLKSFERGGVTYPRADGYYHPGIEVVNPSAVVKGVEKLLAEKPEPLRFENGRMEGNRFMVIGALRLVSPAALEKTLPAGKRNRGVPNGRVLSLPGVEAGLKREIRFEKSSAKATHMEIYERWKGGVSFETVDIGKEEIGI